MKKLIIIITFLFAIAALKAQSVPYERLEKFSKEISKIQFDANGKTYNDGKTDYEISFPEESFTIFFNSQLATNVVYKKSNNKELMYLTENISLGGVVGFTSVIRDNNIIVWKIDFGKFNVTTQIFDNGKLTGTTSSNELILYEYINSNSKASDPSFFNSFPELCNTMKKSIGMITDDAIETENKDWKDKNITKADFVKKYPNSLRTMQVKLTIENKKKKELNEYNKVQSFMDSLCQLYKFKRGLSENEFINYNPEASKIIRPSKRTPYNGGHTLMYWRQNSRLGINIIDFTDGIVSRYEEMVVEEKGHEKSQSYFTVLLNKVKKYIPDSYFEHYINKENTFQTLSIYDPKLKFEIEIKFYTESPNTKYEDSDVSITFQTNKLKT
ncbi:hypothetical protein MCEGE10_02062 [Flavobacteriaceae bacterium]